MCTLPKIAAFSIVCPRLLKTMRILVETQQTTFVWRWLLYFFTWKITCFFASMAPNFCTVSIGHWGPFFLNTKFILGVRHGEQEGKCCSPKSTISTLWAQIFLHWIAFVLKNVNRLWAVRTDSCRIFMFLGIFSYFGVPTIPCYVTWPQPKDVLFLHDSCKVNILTLFVSIVYRWQLNT